MRVLVVEDDLSMRQYLEVLLRRMEYEVTSAESLASAQKVMANGFDLVISDMRLGGESGLSVLQAARDRPSPPEVILITAYGTPATAVEAMRRGAYDYICKPFDNEEFKLLVQKALEKRTLLEENRRLRESLGGASALLGESPGIHEVRALVSKVAQSRSTVLVTGESGTGKELVARAIHQGGLRATRPFLPVNCAALAEGVLESELFGHAKGAFTGAISDRQGLLVSAGEGTVFLDEIGEVPPAMQVRLLRVLQERTVKPVGSTAEVPFQARIVAATNRRLEDEVKAGRFREDLFYRLNVIAIHVPPLRERRQDIRLLADHFLRQFAEELGRPGLRFSEDALGVLDAYEFPGNVRQLQNIVERAATLAEGAELGSPTLPAPVRGEPVAAAQTTEARIAPNFSVERHLDEIERQYLTAALREANGVKTRAAEILGLTFRSFRYRLAKHGLSDIGD
jgi:two-component system, NtrC family, response regulator PilR